MRRMVWLGAGAVLGIVGYRRLGRAAKSLTGQLGSGQVTRQAVQVNQAQVPGAGPGRSLGSDALANRVAPSRAVLGGVRTSAGLALSLATGIVRQAGAYRARRAARAGLGGGEQRTSIGAFLGDVREGMDEYLDAHTDQVRARPGREIG